MSRAEIQSKFDNLQIEDFVEIAESVADSVEKGKVTNEVLVNLSSPDIMMFDPAIKPEYKHVEFEIHGKNILICIGLD